MSKDATRKTSFWKRVLKQARIFLLRGWLVVPIPPKAKAPRTKRWQELRLKIPDLTAAFGPRANIGCLLGEPSGGLVDVDLDCMEAISAATFLLPPTDRIHGRESKPASHCWYLVNLPPSSMKFVDVDGTVLLELRSTGLQTIIPPSIHPSGESLFWKRAKEPGHVQPEELVRAIRRLAACSLVARHWPEKGSRHDLALALSGFLLRVGFSVEEAKSFIAAAAIASGGDEEWRQRQRDVDSTIERLAERKPATGIPRLAALLGNDVVSKLTEWLQVSPGIPTKLHRPTVTAWPEQPHSAAFRGLAGEFVSMILPHSESDPVALLSQFLVAFGNMLGRKPYFLVEADRHFANLYIVLVGPTAKARKGSALSQVMRLLREVDADWAGNCVLSGLSTGEGVIWEVRDESYSKDGEKLLDVGAVDKRRLAVESEFAQQLKLMARESNVLSSVIRQAWDTGNLRTLTKNSPAQATGAHISILGHITVGELRRYLTETELGNGFANRFVWLLVRRSKVLPEGGNLDEEDLQPLIEKLKATIRWARKVERMRRSAKARKLWARVYRELSEGKPGLMGAVISRAEAQVTRLSLVYALLDRSSTIQTQHLKAAPAIWKYAEASARFIFGDFLGDPLADEILRALHVNPQGMTLTEISNHLGRHCRSTDISRALVVLAQSGLATCRLEPTGGRPEERWFVLMEDAKNAKKD